MSERSLDHLLHYMPVIAREAASEWDRRFVVSIMAQAKRTTWQPTAKQMAIMQRLVAELLNEIELEVFE